MSASQKNMLIMVAIAAGVVFASNNNLPIVGDRVRKLLGGGKGLI